MLESASTAWNRLLTSSSTVNENCPAPHPNQSPTGKCTSCGKATVSGPGWAYHVTSLKENGYDSWNAKRIACEIEAIDEYPSPILSNKDALFLIDEVYKSPLVTWLTYRQENYSSVASLTKFILGLSSNIKTPPKLSLGCAKKILQKGPFPTCAEYDPKTHEIRVRDKVVTRNTILHELAHAIVCRIDPAAPKIKIAGRTVYFGGHTYIWRTLIIQLCRDFHEENFAIRLQKLYNQNLRMTLPLPPALIALGVSPLDLGQWYLKKFSPTLYDICRRY